MRSQASADHLSQVVFHAMYGTGFDCLKLLCQITTKSVWVNRKAIGDTLQRKGVKAVVEFAPTRLLYVSKMSRALQTKSIGAAKPCNMTRSSFSGRRKRQFSQAFEEYIQSGSGTVSYTANPASLANALRGLVNELVKPENKKKLLEMGTTDWYNAATGEIHNGEFKEEGVSFFGADRLH